jgi:hypothetical protein
MVRGGIGGESIRGIGNELGEDSVAALATIGRKIDIATTMIDEGNGHEAESAETTETVAAAPGMMKEGDIATVLESGRAHHIDRMLDGAADKSAIARLQNTEDARAAAAAVARPMLEPIPNYRPVYIGVYSHVGRLIQLATQTHTSRRDRYPPPTLSLLPRTGTR